MGAVRNFEKMGKTIGGPTRSLAQTPGGRPLSGRGGCQLNRPSARAMAAQTPAERDFIGYKGTPNHRAAGAWAMVHGDTRV
jgi:hypothetical protein